MNKIFKAGIFLCGLGALIFIILKSGITIDIFYGINYILFLIALLVSLSSMILKIYRWKFCSGLYNVDITMGESARTVMPGLFLMNLIPGKMGEIFKALYSYKKFGMKLSDGISIIFYERIIEVSILFLFAVCIIFMNFSDMFTLLIFGIVITCLLICYKYIEIILKFSSKYISVFQSINISKLSYTNLIKITGITLVMVIFEALHLYIMAMAFGYQLDIFKIIIYSSFVIIVAFISQVPFGIGVSEASMGYFLTQMGVPYNMAISIVLCDRLISMYLALTIGFLYSKDLIFKYDEIIGNNSDA